MRQQAALTKARKKAMCREILHGKLGAVSHENALFLLTDVFPNHPEWADKRGVGVGSVEVRIHGEFNSRGFFLCRVDGSAVDISYRVALDGHTDRGRFTSAARSEIHGQVSQWKRDNPAPASGMQADHIAPFDAILARWLACVMLDGSDVLVVRPVVGHSDLFGSRDLAKSWQAFHRTHARLQWLDAAQNIAKSNTVAPTQDDSSEWLAAYNAADVASDAKSRAPHSMAG